MNIHRLLAIGGTGMDQIFIYGVYHFFAFELCQQFLNEGYQVTGIPYPFQEDDEELAMMVGRNANFIEWKGTNQTLDQTIDKKEQKSFLFFSHYDHQFLEDQHYDEIIEHIQLNLDLSKIDQTIIFQPAEYTCTSIQLDRFTAFQKKVSAIVSNPVYIALPPLYGMRQPEKDLFVHVYRNKEVAEVPKSNFDYILSSETAAAFVVKKLFPSFESTFLKSNGGFTGFIDYILQKEYKWSGKLSVWSRDDLETMKEVEVPGTESVKEKHKEWIQRIDSQHKNTFHV